MWSSIWIENLIGNILSIYASNKSAKQSALLLARSAHLFWNEARLLYCFPPRHFRFLGLPDPVIGFWSTCKAPVLPNLIRALTRGRGSAHQLAVAHRYAGPRRTQGLDGPLIWSASQAKTLHLSIHAVPFHLIPERLSVLE